MSRQRRVRANKYRKNARNIMSVVNRANTGAVHLMRRSAGQLTTSANTSDACGWGLNGLDGGTSTTFNGCDDIGIFLNQKDPTSWTNWNTAASAAVDYKLYVQHAVMEVTIRNSGVNDAIMEAYYIRGIKAIPNSFALPSPTDVYANGFNKQPRAQDPDTGATYTSDLSFATVGTTPFQNSVFCQNYKIYKRQKFRLPPGNEISVMITQKSNWFDVTNTKNRVSDRRYHGILFQQQGCPDGTTSEIYAKPSQVNYVCIRRYNCRFMPVKAPSDALQA